MKQVRNTGRGLKRWGTRLGFRSGTNATEKTRIIAARWIHIHTTPHTQLEALEFTNEMGVDWSEEIDPTILPHTRAFNPYTLTQIRDLSEAAFKEIGDTTPDQSLMRQAVLEKFDEPARIMGMRGFIVGELFVFVACLYRAVCTLTNYTPDAGKLAYYQGVTGSGILDSDFMEPVCATEPWQIHAMPPTGGGSFASWSALSFNSQFLC